jgi:DNA-binding CsgD family transcriptional regulator
MSRPLTHEELSGLIGDIYECVLTPERWNDTLSRFVSVFSPPNWDVAMLMWEGVNAPSVRWVGTTGLVAHARQAYETVFAGRNPWSSRAVSVPLGEVCDTDELVSRDVFRASDLYQQFLKTWNLEIALFVVFDRAAHEQLAIAMPGPDGHDLRELRRGLRLIAPHVQRAMRLSYGLVEARLRAAGSEALLNLGHVAMLALRDDLSVVNCNARGQALAAERVFSIDRGRVVFPDPDVQRRLSELAAGPRPASLALRLEGKDDKPLALLAMTMNPQREQALSGWVEGASILLSLSQPHPAPLIEADRLRAWFNLTATEARLAAALAAGRTLQDYVSERGVTIEAGRYLLKGVFRKTGAETQAQLVATINTVPLG